MTPIGFFISHFFRWLPAASPAGLYAIGKPDGESPVLVTGNFILTVLRVNRALVGIDAWLLVVNTGGINVWCAACGGNFTDSRVIDAIKISNLRDKVSHREIILPQLSAPGINPNAVRRETGFVSIFGPVYTKDIPVYLKAEHKKTGNMRRFKFNLAHRADMVVSMNFPVYLVGLIITAIFFIRIV